MPAVVATVGEFVVAGVVAVVPVCDHLRRLERTRVARQEIVEQKAIDPRVADRELAPPDEGRAQFPRFDEVDPKIGRRKFSRRYGPVGEAIPAGIEVTGMPDPVPVHAANLEILGGEVARIHVPVVQDGATRLLEVAHVPGSRPLGEEHIPSVVLGIAPVLVVVECPVSKVQHPVFTVHVVTHSIFGKQLLDPLVVFGRAAISTGRYLSKGSAGAVPLRRRLRDERRHAITETLSNVYHVRLRYPFSQAVHPVLEVEVQLVLLLAPYSVVTLPN